MEIGLSVMERPDTYIHLDYELLTLTYNTGAQSTFRFVKRIIEKNGSARAFVA